MGKRPPENCPTCGEVLSIERDGNQTVRFCAPCAYRWVPSINGDMKTPFNIMKATAVAINPKGAKKLLELNVYQAQRRPKKKNLKEIAAAMSQGLWRTAEISIAVLPDKSEILVNGQHTLLACIEANVKIFIFEVKYRVKNEKGLAILYQTFDLGRGARSIGDALKAELHANGMTWPLHMARMISSGAAYLEGGTFRADFGKAAQAKLITKYRKEGNFLIDLLPGKATQHKHLRRAPVAMAIMATYNIVGKSAKYFWVIVRDGNQEGGFSSASLLHDYLVNRAETWQRKVLFAKCIIAFNAWYKNTSIESLDYDSADPVPEIIK